MSDASSVGIERLDRDNRRFAKPLGTALRNLSLAVLIAVPTHIAAPFITKAIAEHAHANPWVVESLGTAAADIAADAFLIWMTINVISVMTKMLNWNTRRNAQGWYA
jgi:hypothetical protein